MRTRIEHREHRRAMHPEAVVLYFIVALRSRAFLKTAVISLVLKINSRERERSIAHRGAVQRERKREPMATEFILHLFMSFPSCNSSYNLPRLLSHSHCLSIQTVNCGAGRVRSRLPRDCMPDEPRARTESSASPKLHSRQRSALRDGITETSLSKASHSYATSRGRWRSPSCRSRRRVRRVVGNNAESLAMSEFRNEYRIVVQVQTIVRACFASAKLG